MKEVRMKSKKKGFTVKIDEGLISRFKRTCMRNCKTIRQAMPEILESWIKKNDK